MLSRGRDINHICPPAFGFAITANDGRFAGLAS
jgi:hypothetical protein